MKLENAGRQSKSRALLITLAFLACSGLLVGMPLYRSVSAQKGVSGGGTAGKTVVDRSAAQAALEQAMKTGTFDEMSSAKQQQMLFMAGMRLVDGVLKPYDYTSPVVPPGKVDPDPAASPGDLFSPLAPLPNPLVNNPALDTTAQKTQSETTIVLTGANTAIAGYNDSGSFLNGVNSFTGYSTTTDMGTTWTDRGIVPLLAQQNFGDPVLARSSNTGSVFLATLSGGSNGMNIYKSIDNGVTFTSVADGAPGAASSGTDKEWIAVDNNAGTGLGNVYHVYRDFGGPNGIFFTRSTNDGASFSAPISIASGAAGNVQGAFVFVGPDHAVYAGYYDSAPTPDRIAIRKSTDNGVTFAAAVGVSNLTTTGTNGSLNVPAGYRSSAFPQFIANPTNANILYAIHPDITVAGGADSNIFFQQSTDGGATWSANLRLNTDPGTNVQTQPAIAITPDGTALSVTWQDSRNDPANRKVQRFGVIGTISGTTVTFGPNFQVSQPEWTPVFGQDPVVNSVYMGDYDTMAADNSFFYTTFVDCRNGDQDVRFAKIPKAGPGEILAVTNFTPSFLNVATNTCNDLFVTLTNNGTATATAVSLTLGTATPGVSIQNSPQSYGDIAAGASVANSTAFKLSIDNTFVCGTPIVVTWTASTGETGSFTINSQGLGYQATTMTGQSIVPGTTDVGNHGDDVTTSIALPFTFSFYSQNFTTANVSSNGNLQFTSNSTAFTNVCPLPTATMNNLISPHWDDLRTDNAGGGIFTSITGSAPNRIFNIEWRAIYFGTTTTINFEARLYETTGQIDFIYGTLNGTGSSATVGIQKGTGSGGASDFTQFSCNSAALSPGLKVSFNVLTNCPTGTGACVAVTPCAENFDSVTPPALPTGWTATNAAGPAPLWVTTATAPDTAPNDVFIDDPAVVSDKRLDSKPFPIIAAGAVLTFRHTFALESSGGSFFDGGVVEISIGGGAFTDIITAGGSFVGGTQAYVGTISSSFSNPLAGRSAFSGTNAGGFGTYVTTSINLPASTNGQSVVIRWRMGSDLSVGASGWRVDTVSVSNSNCAATCSLTCPANITVSTDPNLCTALVNYPPPTSTGTCGTITCTPPSGTAFPLGTTTVTCTAAAAGPGASPAGETQAVSSFSVSPPSSKGSTTSGSASKSQSGPGISGQIPTTSNSGSASGGSGGAPTKPASPFAILYDQTNNPAPVPGGVTSQNFEAAFDNFDTETADDFVVPAGQTWTVNQVFVVGEYSGVGPAASVNVVFYNDAAGLPGAVVATRAAQTYVDQGSGDFLITLAPTVVLSPGTYWVGVQANQDFGTAGQWFWDNRTTISNQGAAWRNPGGGFGTGCASFGRKTTCLPTQNGPDELFQILGTSGAAGGGSTCTFTITVNDTQPPSITCPPSISAVLPTPGATCVPVTYCPPTVSDNCPGVTFACVPPSGSCFVPGTTTVTCTATDGSGLTASCSFTVTVFNLCIQDDSNPNIVLLVITSGAQTGQYRFCCNGTTFTGVGTVKQIGSNFTLTHTPPDRRVQATFNIDATSTASLQVPPGTTICTITDKPNIGVHTCICGSPGPGCN